ncbi:hypothetical protein OEJ84_17255 [Bacillus subtilis]|uniref:hypothetical protein n=1 Tax=Bacillus subtilis TaxID=1423 RepID=UPI002938E87E|nr:hypothetical protein [Bacillus subtilis]WNA14233.1 hypothetical protein phi182_65 [Bacillus phage phi18-2]WOF29643.1 hypothetical protein OEJ84_17255 [Bacillus subtilis]
MDQGYFLIAGKTEGFSYEDAIILRCGSEIDAESLVNSLRHEGYTIFYVTKTVDRIDDNVAIEEAE